MRPWKLLVALLAAVSLLAAACGDDDGDDDAGTDTSSETTAEDASSTDALTVYSGRSEELVGPLLEQFTEETGIEVEVRYGDTAEMASLILTEGDNSPADVYYGQDAGALGALSNAGRLVELDDAILDLVPEGLRSADGTWVGTSGRSRVVVYNTDELAEEDLPDSILEYTDPEWSGRIGWAPTNGSFQAFVTALRVAEGEDAAREWLEGIVANDPVTFDGNSAIVEAVANGEVEVGFVNHYYLYRYLAEDADYPAANYLFPSDDPGGLVNVAGAGVLDTSDQQDEATQLVEFLLSEEAQRYFADETYEIPLVEGVEPAEGVPSVSEINIPDIDLGRIDDLEGTLALLTDVGAL
ncbi:iron ABC transporter substrate-binding protein [Actinomarinicola tropica]|uniref:Extracellular solute-binding protein n=1 Tax=Actinomarinicola tropica TaxID=2789776 RepID=A0A5Q2RV28_9ACTN|nr:extracellular solute-binding protein [Actinomarinicola tropica]